MRPGPPIDVPVIRMAGVGEMRTPEFSPDGRHVCVSVYVLRSHLQMPDPQRANEARVFEVASGRCVSRLGVRGGEFLIEVLRRAMGLIYLAGINGVPEGEKDNGVAFLDNHHLAMVVLTEERREGAIRDDIHRVEIRDISTGEVVVSAAPNSFPKEKRVEAIANVYVDRPGSVVHLRGLTRLPIPHLYATVTTTGRLRLEDQPAWSQLFAGCASADFRVGLAESEPRPGVKECVVLDLTSGGVLMTLTEKNSPAFWPRCISATGSYFVTTVRNYSEYRTREPDAVVWQVSNGKAVVELRSLWTEPEGARVPQGLRYMEGGYGFATYGDYLRYFPRDAGVVDDYLGTLDRVTFANLGTGASFTWRAAKAHGFQTNTWFERRRTFDVDPKGRIACLVERRHPRDGTANLAFYDVNTGARVGTCVLKTHPKPDRSLVASLRFSPDGNWLAVVAPLRLPDYDVERQGWLVLLPWDKIPQKGEQVTVLLNLSGADPCATMPVHR